jgi:hypothetical protein
MGLFSKTPKPDPAIQIGETRLRYSTNQRWWTFTHKNMEFCAFNSSLVWPGDAGLDSIIKEFEHLQPEMKERIRSGNAVGGGGIPTDEGETVLIKLDELAGKGSYEVGWSGGRTWGDMGVDFVVRGGEIVEEFWGD